VRLLRHKRFASATPISRNDVTERVQEIETTLLTKKIESLSWLLRGDLRHMPLLSLRLFLAMTFTSQ
jgi:hypothetical protein